MPELHECLTCDHRVYKIHVCAAITFLLVEVKKKKSEMTADERRAEKKRKLKEMFDTQYDMKGDTEFYDNWKEELEQQAKVSNSCFVMNGQEALLYLFI